MPFIKEIVEKINLTLTGAPSGALCYKPFQTGMFGGLATLTQKQLKAGGKIITFPAITTSGKIYEYVGPNDIYPIIIYHRAGRTTIQRVKENEFGDDENLKQTIPMKMFVYGRLSRLANISAADLETAIITGFPNSFKVNDMTITATPTGSNLEKIEVFNQEFKNVDPCLREDECFIQIDYNIESEFEKSCFKICDAFEVL